MSKPTILTVDDDPMVSAAITRDLRTRYGADQGKILLSSARAGKATHGSIWQERH